MEIIGFLDIWHFGNRRVQLLLNFSKILDYAEQNSPYISPYMCSIYTYKSWIYNLHVRAILKSERLSMKHKAKTRKMSVTFYLIFV